MDVISLGKAMKAKRMIQKLNNRLGSGVEDIHENVKTRLEELEKKDPQLTLYNRVSSIERNTAINLNKHNLNINTILNKNKYNLSDLVFDDFADESGIDIPLSSGYLFDEAGRKVVMSDSMGIAEVVTLSEQTDTTPAMITVSLATNENALGGKSAELQNGTHDKTIGINNVLQLIGTDTTREEYQEDITPPLTANTTTVDGVTYVSSTLNTISTTYYDAWKAFTNKSDGNYDYWEGYVHPTNKVWLKIDIAEAKVIKKYSITSRYWITGAGLKQYCPRDWFFEGSNNDVDWDVLDTQAGVTNWRDDFGQEIKDFVFKNDIAYRYYRLRVVATNGNDNVAIGDLGLMDTIPQKAYDLTGSYESPILDLGDNFKSLIKIERNIQEGYKYFSRDLTDVVTGPTSAVTSSPYSSESYPSWKVFDNTGNSALFNQEYLPNVWVQYNFGNGNGKVVNKYTLSISGVGEVDKNRAPKSWIFEGSHDGISYDLLDEQTEQVGWLENSTAETREYTLADHRTPYQYYRITIAENNGDINNVVINDMQLMTGYSFSEVEILTSTSHDGVSFSNYLPLNNDGTIASPSARYMKIKAIFTSGDETVTSTAHDFLAEESTNFQADDQLIFDGSLKINTAYSEALIEDITFADEGDLYRLTINKTDFKNYEKIEVK